MPFNIKNIKKGQEQLPPRIVLAGEEGVGKSTFGNRAADPIFICAENGLVGPEFKDTPNVTPKSWAEIQEVIKSLVTEDHQYKTLVIDTIDWIEPLLNDYLCARDKKSNIEDYGYGKGYTLAAAEWRLFLASLENLRRTKKMIVVLNAHVQIKSFSNPLGENYDRYELKVSKQIAAMSKEWADAVLFARYETYTHKEGMSKAKGVGGTKRIIHTNKCAAYDAKNRYGMPDSLPLSYDDVMQAIDAGEPDTVENIINEINSTIQGMPEKDTALIKQTTEKYKTNPSKLKEILNRCRAKAA